VTKIGLSIFQKLLILILSLIFVALSAQASYLSVRQLGRNRTLLELKAERYARLVSKQVESAVAFNDRETAREVFDSIAQDPEFASLTLFGADGGVLKAHGTITPIAQQHHAALRGEVIMLSDRIAAIMPVVSLEGPRGTLVLELSTDRLKAGGMDVVVQALIAIALALLLGALGAYWIARSLGNRLTAIASAAGSVAQGRLDEPALIDAGSDEIGALARAFNTMLQQLRTLFAQIQRSALEEQRRLGQLVAERTSELDSRNADMRLVLDHVGQGFVMIGRDGKMSRERSAVLERWLGPAPRSERLADYLAAVAPDVGAWFALGWEAVVEGVLQLELGLDQLPKSLTIGERVIHIGYRPILGADGELERVLCVLSDLTPELERSRAAADERELTVLCTRLFNDRSGTVEFCAEVDALLETLALPSEPEAFRRCLHTLKGSAGLYGVDSLAVLCHELEESLGGEEQLAPELLAPLVQRWSSLRTKLEPLLDTQSGSILLELGEYETLLEAVERGAPRSAILQTLQSFRLEPVQTRLARMAEHAERLAERLDKSPVEVRIDADKTRLAREPWSDFWSAAVHVVRNAVDHGLEPPDEREQLGKRVPAQLNLRARLAGERFVVEVEDDGRGIDWDALASKARVCGMPSATRDDLIDAMFTNGLSTRVTATDVSGRGVGLDVLRAACSRTGGTIEVESKKGEGTMFRFSWPAERVHDALARGHHPPVSHRIVTRQKEPPNPAASDLCGKGPRESVSK
jgi:two-component system chemotaxis sensor kinase CheA